MKHFVWVKVPGQVWFRLFGAGLVISDRRIHPALFSERNGFVKRLRIGPYSIRYLGRDKKEIPHEEPRFKVSELKCWDSPVYDFSIQEHLNAYQTQDGVKMRLVQMWPTERGVRVVWEKQ